MMWLCEWAYSCAVLTALVLVASCGLVNKPAANSPIILKSLPSTNSIPSGVASPVASKTTSPTPAPDGSKATKPLSEIYPHAPHAFTSKKRKTPSGALQTNALQPSDVYAASDGMIECLSLSGLYGRYYGPGVCPQGFDFYPSGGGGPTFYVFPNPLPNTHPFFMCRNGLYYFYPSTDVSCGGGINAAIIGWLADDGAPGAMDQVNVCIAPNGSSLGYDVFAHYDTAPGYQCASAGQSRFGTPPAPADPQPSTPPAPPPQAGAGGHYAVIVHAWGGGTSWGWLYNTYADAVNSTTARNGGVGDVLVALADNGVTPDCGGYSQSKTDAGTAGWSAHYSSAAAAGAAAQYQCESRAGQGNCWTIQVCTNGANI